MSGRAFILGSSLLLNGVLAAVLWRGARPAAPPPGPELTAPATSPPVVVKTNTIVRRQFFTWSELESQDYPTFIKNLREIGCPEQTIRDIIIADVNQLYARKQAAELVNVDLEWWRAEPARAVLRAISERNQALDTERRELLTRLLGPGWEESQAAPATSRAVILAGPVLGNLSPEVRKAVEDITARSAERIRALTRAAEAEGREPDPAELARLRQQTRNELAQVLTAEELEEYLLRFSHNANLLRADLRGFDVTPEEFRRLFRALDPIYQKMQLTEGGDDLATKKAAEVLEKQKEAALRQALGMERHRVFKLNKDPAFVRARDLVQRIEGPPEAVLPIYEVQRATETERQRIRADLTLTEEERDEALAIVDRELAKSMRQILGEQAYQRLRPSENP